MSERGDKGGQGQSGHASNEAKTIKLKKTVSLFNS